MKKSAVICFYILGIFLLFYYNFYSPTQQEQFINLAYSFLQGKLYFHSVTFDAAYYNGRYFWPLGPFPGVLLTPFVYLLGDQMRQGFLLFFLNILNIFLLFRIARKLTNNLTNSLTISFAVIFSTAYLGIALVPWSWYFAQTVGFSLILLALEAYFFNRSWLLIGFFLALAFATRIPLIFAAIFFILNIAFADLSKKVKLRNLILFLTPIFLSIILIGIYNFSRFDDALETGYSWQLLEGPVAENRSLGLWSFVHIPANLYTIFLKLPGSNLAIDGSGLSLLFTSTIFIWILFSDWKKSIVKFSTITSLVTMFAHSGSFTNGSWQYGFRYAIDYYPFLFVILAYAFKKEVSYVFLTLALGAFLVNFYFVNVVFSRSIPVLKLF